MSLERLGCLSASCWSIAPTKSCRSQIRICRQTLSEGCSARGAAGDKPSAQPAGRTLGHTCSLAVVAYNKWWDECGRAWVAGQGICGIPEHRSAQCCTGLSCAFCTVGAVQSKTAQAHASLGTGCASEQLADSKVALLLGPLKEKHSGRVTCWKAAGLSAYVSQLSSSEGAIACAVCMAVNGSMP